MTVGKLRSLDIPRPIRSEILDPFS